MNRNEQRAWDTLMRLGAEPITLGGKRALDCTPIRLRSARTMADFCHAFTEVVGRSKANRRHVDRRGCQVFVVTSTPEGSGG